MSIFTRFISSAWAFWCPINARHLFCPITVDRTRLDYCDYRILYLFGIQVARWEV